MKSISTVLAAGALAVAGALKHRDSRRGSGHSSDRHSGHRWRRAPGVHGWTVSDLRPSSDAIPYQPRGTLWEATATDEAIQGTVFPVSPTSARARPAVRTISPVHGAHCAGHCDRPALLRARRPAARSTSTSPVTPPNSMVYQAGGTDLIRLVAPAPQQAPPAAPQPQAPSTGSAPQAPAAGGSQPGTGGAAGSVAAPRPSRAGDVSAFRQLRYPVAGG